jgi:hypothetical protein
VRGVGGGYNKGDEWAVWGRGGEEAVECGVRKAAKARARENGEAGRRIRNHSIRTLSPTLETGLFCFHYTALTYRQIIACVNSNPRFPA